MAGKNKLTKNFYSFLFVFAFYIGFLIFMTNIAYAAPIVKGYLVIPEDWKARAEPDIPKYKHNILGALERAQEFYSSKLDETTFLYDTDVKVIYAKGRVDNYVPRVGECIWDLFTDFSGLKIPDSVYYPSTDEVHAIFVVGSKNLGLCGGHRLGGGGLAFYSHTLLENLGIDDPILLSHLNISISHELGHAFGLTFSEYALGHPCSVLSKDQCQRDVGTASKPYPPGEECLNSTMGFLYCHSEDGKVISPDYQRIGFDNSVWNPEIKNLKKVLGISLPVSSPTPKPAFTPSPSLTPTPSPSVVPIPSETPVGTSTPTVGFTDRIIKIIVSNYQDFGLNDSSDGGSMTQTFDLTSPNPLIWKKSTISPKSPIYLASVNPDGTSGQISAVDLSDGQTYQVPNSSFVIKAKVEKKITAVKINNQDLSFPFTMPVSIHLLGNEGTPASFSIPVIISYNDGSSKSLLFTFNYNPNSSISSPSPSVSSTPSPTTNPSSTPVLSLSNDEILCQARGGICQASCSGEFSSQIGACTDTEICCSKPVENPLNGSKCPGTEAVNFGWGGPCRLGETDKALPANGGSACSVASCYFKQDINEYCWYNSGEPYVDYEGCKAKGVIINTDLYAKEK